MRINTFQYKMMRLIAESGTVAPRDLAKQLDASLFRVSKNLRPLKDLGLISKSGKIVKLENTGIAPVLARFMLEHPGIEKVLSDSGFSILQLFEKPKTLDEVAKETNISKRTAYRYVQMFLNRGMLVRQNGHCILNDKLWSDLRELIAFSKTQKNLLRMGIPSSAKIYAEDSNRTIFSSNLPVNASPTAFSKYAEFGIPLLESEKIYRIPVKKLTIKEIFTDSLNCLTDIRRKILATLFFVKHRKKLESLSHPELDNIKKVLSGENIQDYPTLDEIKERAELYDIKI